MIVSGATCEFQQTERERETCILTCISIFHILPVYNICTYIYIHTQVGSAAIILQSHRMTLHGCNLLFVNTNCMMNWHKTQLAFPNYFYGTTAKLFQKVSHGCDHCIWMIETFEPIPSKSRRWPSFLFCKVEFWGTKFHS